MKIEEFIIFFFILVIIAIQIPDSVNAIVFGEYDIVVAENGNSFVFLSLTGNETVNIPLPLDVDALTVENALYLQAENGIDIVLLSDDDTAIAYSTFLLTSKVGEEEWNFEMGLPVLDVTNITLSLPKNVRISELFPKEGLLIKNLENSNDVIWELKEGQEENKNIYVSYKFIETVVTSTTTISTTTTITITTQIGIIKDYSVYYLLILLVLVIVFILVYFFK